MTAVIASQVISNVPAALLLSGFTENITALIIGTNLGGLGTLIASMASLISYKQVARQIPGEKKKYFWMVYHSKYRFFNDIGIGKLSAVTIESSLSAGKGRKDGNN